MWVRSQNCGCLVTGFCYQLIAKLGNKTATVSWLDPYDNAVKYIVILWPCGVADGGGGLQMFDNYDYLIFAYILIANVFTITVHHASNDYFLVSKNSIIQRYNKAVVIKWCQRYPNHMFWNWHLESLFLSLFLAATKQLYKWYFPSVCPSVCLSVCPSVRHTFLTMFSSSYHHEFSGVITSDRSDVHAKGQGQRSKVKVTEVTTQLYRFQTVTPVWIHIWWWNDAYSFIMLRRGALLFFKVISQISRSHGSKNRQIWPRLGVSDCKSSLNTPMATKCNTKLEVA